VGWRGHCAPSYKEGGSKIVAFHNITCQMTFREVAFRTYFSLKMAHLKNPIKRVQLKTGLFWSFWGLGIYYPLLEVHAHGGLKRGRFLTPKIDPKMVFYHFIICKLSTHTIYQFVIIIFINYSSNYSAIIHQFAHQKFINCN